MGKNESEQPGASRDLDDEIKKAMSEAEAAVTAMKGDEGDADSSGIDIDDGDSDPSPAPGPAAAEEIERLQGEVAQLRDKWLRAVADHENFRKRVKRDVDDATQHATLKLLEAFLPTVDNLERALSVATEEDNKLVEGIRMVTRDFLGALAKHGITPIPAVGRPFDPAVHDALQQVDSPDHAPGVVVQEFEKGYLRGERLLRPARVIVAGPGSTGEPPADVGDEGETDA
jgi:molecular chaperone GrpE